ncbi:DUF6011 domain-containing protein [Kitasatospora sp. NBC_01287]|uniref:DUF6011 domain-containing protein n=1 Tax=Kitasatospora sp. NBC_01287 TaxID=2903573 RepID=UPI0022573BC4|nr:DUF6011 domain-containing protein [Kitasatospora sp. NBC_01287]MCX4744306.1 DUF6011 domain-containing protein [Kitasatospora sp. NBC_01287]
MSDLSAVGPGPSPVPSPVPGPGRSRAPGPDASSGPGPEAAQRLPGTAVQERLAELVTCRGCGRLLHDPESRMLRLGPGCRHTGGEPVRRHEVAQDALPGL